jgi:hypothetical protein
MNDVQTPTPTPPTPTPPSLTPTPPGSPPSSTPSLADGEAARLIAEEALRKAEAPPPKVEPPKAQAPDPNDTKANPYKIDELKIPDGFEPDPVAAESFVKLVNEHGISRSTASALIEMQAGIMKAASDASSKAFTDMQAAWQDEVQKNPNIGGQKLQSNLSNIGKLIDFAGPVLAPKIRAAMDLTGAGNHPAVVEWLSGIAKELVESGHISGGPPMTTQAAADRIYDGKK